MSSRIQEYGSATDIQHVSQSSNGVKASKHPLRQKALEAAAEGLQEAISRLETALGPALDQNERKEVPGLSLPVAMPMSTSAVDDLVVKSVGAMNYAEERIRALIARVDL